MFNFVIKRGLYNLVLDTYEKYLYIYKNEIAKILPTLTDDTSEEEMFALNKVATQKYYEVVFNMVCQEISNKLPKFKLTLGLNLASYNFDPDNLAAAHIYDFVYWCLTKKNAETNKCIKINHYVNELKNYILIELEK